MLPKREKAEEILKEAESCNPGPWGNHSRVAAHCAEKIAMNCNDLDADKAYILGLLHDIGRKFGVRHLGHVSDGYSYMMSQGYEEVARICLTHSFNTGKIEDYIGRFDTTEEELHCIQQALRSTEMDEYDRLIQLCDALAGAEGVLDIEERMEDVKHRYSLYPQEKWDRNLALKKHFEKKMGKDVYLAVDKDNTNTNRKTQIPITENDRLALLPYTHDDDADMTACWKDIETQRGYNNILDENCEQFFVFEISKFPFWVTVLDKQTNCKVGSIRLGLDAIPDLAIWIYPKYRSMGYGTESFRMSLKYLFKQYPELSAGCYIDNEKSLRMLKRIGFTRVPHDDIEEPNCFTGEPTKMLAFKITADQIKD